MSFSKSSIGRLISASWQATVGQRKRLTAFLIMFIVAYSVNLLIVPKIVAYILSLVSKQGLNDQTLHQAFLAIVLYTLLKFASSILHHFARFIQATVAYYARMKVMGKMFNAFLAFPLRWHLHRHSGENLAKLHRAVGAVDQSISTYLWQFVEGVVKIVFAGLAVFALDYIVAANVLFMCAFSVCLMLFFNRKLVSLIRENNAFYDKLNRTVVDFFFNIVTVKTLRLEDAGREYFGAHQPTGLGVCRKISKFQELKWGSVAIGYGLVIGSSLWIYFLGHKGSTTPLDVGEIYMLIFYLEQIFQVVGSFTGYYGAILESATAYEDGDRVLKELEDLPVKKGPRLAPKNWQDFELSNLAFSYGLDISSGIRGLNLKIARGEKIALVGPSGGGKSTLLKIMGGMIAPETCNLKFDSQSGFEIDDLSNISLLIPQEPEIFTETVEYNLAVGQQVSQDVLDTFVKICRVDAVIEKLPGSWSNFLAEKGLNLSGGERQRIALARGLIRSKDREVLLLDEPTSSVDPFTEKEIFHGILAYFSRFTILTACHRLALVPLFDKVIYVKDGLIAEVGSFSELLARKGYFAQAWEDYQTNMTNSDT